MGKASSADALAYGVLGGSVLLSNRKDALQSEVLSTDTDLVNQN